MQADSIETSFPVLEPESGVYYTREQRRSRRQRLVRARSVNIQRLAKSELEVGRLLFPEFPHPRPAARADCIDGLRPCPFVSCRHHLYLDVSPRTGSIKLNFPDLEVWELTESCSLDVADRGGVQVQALGALMNLTRERVRQLETHALTAAHGRLEAGVVGELLGTKRVASYSRSV